jgi:hypothetical protein
MQSPNSNSPDRRRQVCRLGLNYQLAMARLVVQAVDRDILTALILLAITRANVADLMRNPATAAAYQGLDGNPPDELRRPVSVYAIARQLRTPYETVRRHVGRLKDEGLCESHGRGVVVPSRVLVSELWLSALQKNWRLAMELVNEAALFGIAAEPFEWPMSPDVRRQVVRASIDFFLDGLSLMAQPQGVDVTSILVVRTIAFANVEHLVHDRRLGAAFAAMGSIPGDDVRRPVSVYAVAKALPLPYETTRRITGKLVALDIVERRDEGVIVPTRVLARPEALAGFIEFAGLTEVFLSRLASLGVKAGMAA